MNPSAPSPRYILNVGRAIGRRKKLLSWGEILKALETAGFEICSAIEFTSGTEPTLVIEANARMFAGLTLPGVSSVLGQDCIALWDLWNNTGSLCGPRADKWGPFKAEYFILPSGKTLESTLH